MPRWLRILLVALPVALFVVVVAGWIAVRAIDPAALARLAAQHVKSATGRELVVRGPVHLSIWPLAVVAEDVAFANAPWGIGREMAKVQRVEGRVRIAPLLRREIELEELRLVNPDVLLETDREGRGNWVLGEAGRSSTARAAEGGSLALPLVVDRLRIEDGRITFRDGRTASTTALLIHAFAAEQPTLARRSATYLLDATFRDQRFRIDATTVGIRDWAADTTTKHPVGLALATSGARVSVEGKLARAWPLSLEAKLGAELTSTGGLSKLAGAALAAPVPLKLSAAATAGEHQVVLDSLVVETGEQSVRGKLGWRTDTTRPVVKGELHAATLDLRRLQASAAPAASAERAPAKRGLSPPAALLPLAAVRAVDAEATLGVDRLVVDEHTVLERVRAKLALAGGRLQLDPVELAGFGGEMTGRVAVDAVPGRTPTLAVQVRAKGLDGPGIARALGSKIPLSGARTSVSVDLSGPADTAAKFKAGTNGSVLVQAGSGRIGSVRREAGAGAVQDVLAIAVPSLSLASGAELQCAVARVEIRNGVATSRRGVAIETDKVNAVVSGTIALASGELDLAVRPSLRKGIASPVADLVDVVRVRGTLEQPRVAVDTLDAARALAGVGGALATSGVSLLGQSLLRRGTDDPTPCRTALSGAARVEPAAPAAAPVTPSPAGEDPAREVGRALRRLFGR